MMAFILKCVTPLSFAVSTSPGTKTSVLLASEAGVTPPAVVFVAAFVYFTKSVRGSGDDVAVTARTVAVTPLIPPVITLPMTASRLQAVSDVYDEPVPPLTGVNTTVGALL